MHVRWRWAMGGLGSVLAALASASPVAAQSVSAATDDLCANNVTFEPEAQDIGFLTSSDLANLDRVALAQQGAEGFFKVVVLGSPPKDDQFASKVLDELGGDGRVVVFDPTDTTVVSTVDDTTEQRAAEQAAIQTFNATSRLADATTAVAEQLGIDASGAAAIPPLCTGGSTGGGSSGSTSSAGNGLVWVLVGLLVVVGGIMLVVALSSRKRKGAASAGIGEQKVRAEVDKASNLVIDLSDRVEAPDAAPAAKEAYTTGASAFADIQDELDEADTRDELEAIYPKLVTLTWNLETAKALLDGQPAPPVPTPEPLFPPSAAPAAPVPGSPLPAPGGYRSQPNNPWMTTAAVTAMTVLLSKGMGGGGGRSRRPPADDGWFDQQYGGARGGVRRPSGGFQMGGGGSGGRRGMGRRK